MDVMFCALAMVTILTSIGQASTTFGGFVDDLDMLIGGLQGGSWSGVSSGGQTGKAMFETIVSGGDFSVPILTDPSQIIKLLLGGNADLLADLLGLVGADAVNVLQTDDDALAGRNVDARDTSHALHLSMGPQRKALRQ